MGCESNVRFDDICHVCIVSERVFGALFMAALAAT